MASASLTGIPTNHNHFQLPFDALGVIRTGSPHFYRSANPGESEAEFVARRASELDEQIIAAGPETVAAMIAEPVSGAGGVLIPLRAITKPFRQFWINTALRFGMTKSSAGLVVWERILVPMPWGCVLK